MEIEINRVYNEVEDFIKEIEIECEEVIEEENFDGKEDFFEIGGGSIDFNKVENKLKEVKKKLVKVEKKKF